MSRSKLNLSRRQLLANALKGGVGLGLVAEQLAGLPLIGSGIDALFRHSEHVSLDAYQMLAQAVQGQGAFFGVHKAMAGLDDQSDWSLVQIKVCNHIYAPLIFALGQLEADGTLTTGPNVRRAGNAAGQSGSMLKAKGVEEIATSERFKALRLNKWFASILEKGTADGAAPNQTNLLGLDPDDVQPLSSNVAVQAFVGLNQVDSVNHSLRGCKLRKTLPDLTLFAQQNQLIASPLGISCFMMGNTYDQAEGALSRNAVLGSGVGENLVVASRTVGEYVTQVSQFVGATYSDRESIEQNIVYRLDKLVASDPKLRREMIASLQQFRVAVLKFRGSALLESRFQTFDASQGNGQSSSTTSTGATSEFLGQCKYVAQALDMPGTPLRNFSLFLNIVDLDGRDLDATINNPNGDADNIRAYSYVEGMRQLAMGLNLLGKKISQGKKLIVSVSSEGGRSTNLGDSRISCGFVLGPKRAGMLTDALYADMAAINKPDSPVVVDSAGIATNWGIADSLKDVSGADAPPAAIPSTGDVQMGIVDFLEEKTGLNVRKKLGSEDGTYVKLKRFG